MLKDDSEEVTQENVNTLNHNHNWGDSLPSNAKGHTIKVVYQNVHHSISAAKNPSTNTMLDNLNNMEADLLMAAETNVNWKSAKCRNDFKATVSKVWPSNRIAFSTSDVGLQFDHHSFLPGGTCTMAVDNLSLRVIKVGEDESGLGRWSYLTMEGQGGRKLTFITAYRICRGAMRGNSTTSMQQAKVLAEHKMKCGEHANSVDTNFLREKFVNELALFIQSLQREGHAVVLGLDANETPSESQMTDGEPKPGSISWLLDETDMAEVFAARHNVEPDSTTTTPRRFIDRVAVSGIPIERVTLLAANVPATSDHLGIVVDLDLKYLFTNSCSPLVSPHPRKLTTGNIEAVKKYIDFVKRQFTEHRIVERCRALRDLCDAGEFGEHHRQQLYSLDKQVTEILLGAENRCNTRKVQRNLWSPALQKAGKKISYWKHRLRLNGKLDDNTKTLGLSLAIPATLQQALTLPVCQFYHTIAWKTYKGIQSHERVYRDKFLKERAQVMAAKGNGDVAAAIKQIRHREKARSDFAAIRRGYGIQKQGLATLDVPDPITGGRQLITQAEEIHEYLLKRNEKHFSQATFTTFGDAGPGFQFIDPANPDSDAHIDAMLEGVFEPWEGASPNVREFLRELKCTI